MLTSLFMGIPWTNIPNSQTTVYVAGVGNHDPAFPTITGAFETVLLCSFLARISKILFLCWGFDFFPLNIVTRCSNFLFLHFPDSAHDLPFSVCCSKHVFITFISWYSEHTSQEHGLPQSTYNTKFCFNAVSSTPVNRYTVYLYNCVWVKDTDGLYCLHWVLVLDKANATTLAFFVVADLCVNDASSHAEHLL